MGAGGEPADVREIQVLGDEQTPRLLGRFPHGWIVAARKALGPYGIDVVAERRQSPNETRRELLIELDLHPMRGTPGTRRSSSAERAAKATTALT